MHALPVPSIFSPPRGESEMSQLVSVTLLHQGSTAPVKNWRVAIKFPLSPCITFFFSSKLQKKRKYHKENEFREKKVKPLCCSFVIFFLEDDAQINSDKLGVYVSSASLNLEISRDTSTERINFFSKFKNVLTAFLFTVETPQGNIFCE